MLNSQRTKKSIKAILANAERFLEGGSLSPRLDVELLMCYVLKQDRSFLITHADDGLSFWQKYKYTKLLNKRKKGVPLAYITGNKEFYFLDFYVDQRVLIPRPDTEEMVESVLQWVHKEGLDKKSTILIDMGTGSGCIPISVLKNTKKLNAIGLDVSCGALGIAKKNAKHHGVGERIKFIKSNLSSKLDKKSLEDKTIILTANLPYVPEKYKVAPDTKFEPNIALYSGEDGLDLYRKLLKELQDLRPIRVYLELFVFQIEALERHLEGYEILKIKPMLGQARMMLLQKSSH